jgi:hypothetical protein
MPRVNRARQWRITTFTREGSGETVTTVAPSPDGQNRRSEGCEDGDGSMTVSPPRLEPSPDRHQQNHRSDALSDGYDGGDGLPATFSAEWPPGSIGEQENTENNT